MYDMLLAEMGSCNGTSMNMYRGQGVMSNEGSSDAISDYITFLRYTSIL